jgi:hypothetical protein
LPKPLRLLIAVILGFVAGSAVNMGLILVSGRVIPPPAGADVATTEGLRASMHLFEPRHFIFPFLAHAMGTFVGAVVGMLLAPERSAIAPYTIGGLFFLGGCASVFMLPAPALFSAIDLLFAYFPAAWAATWLVSSRRLRTTNGV